MMKATKPFSGTHPVKINEGFKCLKCGKTNPKAEKTCRNHCAECLYSVHVDKVIPGDRSSTCLGLMDPVKIDYNAKKGFQITHMCIKCGKSAKNKSASDDNAKTITKIMMRQNTTHEPNENVIIKKSFFARKNTKSRARTPARAPKK